LVIRIADDGPIDHWIYDSQTGVPSRAGFRREAGYWYKTERTGTAQQRLFAEEERDDLPLVNLLRKDVRRWREAGYRGASKVTRDLLNHWASAQRPRRLFFCQREAAETIIYLAELRIPGKASRTGFKNFELSEENLARLLRGERPLFPQLVRPDFFPMLVDPPADPGLPLALRRLGCKMATGSGKTVVMAMLISWAFCNRAMNPGSTEFPSAALVCCPNLTVKERLQVLRPENPENYYAAFDLVPVKYRSLLQYGKVLVENWHRYAVVDKGPETPETLARRVLGDLYERMPLMVLNDEGHHCWRPRPVNGEDLAADERRELKEEAEEARVWLTGLDWINNARGGNKPGISFCVDLSATPFYIKGSGYPEGQPFPWLVSDFGLVDAIECGIVKIPRLPVFDDTARRDLAGRPDPKYFRLWHNITGSLSPADKLPSGRPKAEVVYREAEGALEQIAGQWVERFKYIEEANPHQERVPPVLIVVCDNTDIAEVFYRKISGESESETVTEQEVEEVEAGEDEEETPRKRKGKRKKKVVYGRGAVFPEYFSNTPDRKHTIRIDTKLLGEAESEDPNKTRQDAAEELRRIIATVGKRGQPGEFVRCVVSVSMLTEGWDANNVTHILGIRAFGSQLLCEQVVGRGLRRMSYDPDPQTGLLPEEYVDVYGIPFSVIPFKGRPVHKATPEDKPKNPVYAVPERADAMEMRFPIVEGYVFALAKNLLKCNVAEIEPLSIDPRLEPTTTFLRPTAGYLDTPWNSVPFEFVQQDRDEYYSQTHLQGILFQIAKCVVDELLAPTQGRDDKRTRVMRLQSRHQLFPQVFRFVQEYVKTRVRFNNVDQRELGLEKYSRLIVERIRDALYPDETAGEPPLLPVLNRYKPYGSTSAVDFTTTRPVVETVKSHIKCVVQHSDWEGEAARLLDLCPAVACYARNDHLGLTIPYEYLGVDHSYEPDFLVRLTNGLTVVLEIKGFEVHDPERTNQKHTAARKWVTAVNNLGDFGRWDFLVCRDLDQLMPALADL
ncbi:MAG: DEAD/DEAH box helicase family protein, partial [Thermoguttaceae bacterium]|nr:DEAD/DEAH box helicase family protein [Thermoguttaceae bacterium]